MLYRMITFDVMYVMIFITEYQSVGGLLRYLGAAMYCCSDVDCEELS
jgi:hypothetical protein